MYQDPVEMLAGPLDEIDSTVSFEITGADGSLSLNVNLVPQDEDQEYGIREGRKLLAKAIKVESVSDHQILKATQMLLCRRQTQVSFALGVIHRQEKILKKTTAKSQRCPSLAIKYPVFSAPTAKKTQATRQTKTKSPKNKKTLTANPPQTKNQKQP